MFSVIVPQVETIAVTAVSDAFALPLADGARYLYVCDVASWITQGATPTADTDGLYVPAATAVIIDGRDGVALATVRASGDGRASLVPIRTW